MIPRIAPSSTRVVHNLVRRSLWLQLAHVSYSSRFSSFPGATLPTSKPRASAIVCPFGPGRAFSTSSKHNAAPQPADAIVDTLTELYGTARDEFEIAAEETEKKTVYAADDRDAAREAFAELKDAFEEALKTSDSEVGKDVQSRVGQRIRELENALTALEESAMED